MTRFAIAHHPGEEGGIVVVAQEERSLVREGDFRRRSGWVEEDRRNAVEVLDHHVDPIVPGIQSRMDAPSFVAAEAVARVEVDRGNGQSTLAPDCSDVADSGCTDCTLDSTEVDLRV